MGRHDAGSVWIWARESNAGSAVGGSEVRRPKPEGRRKSEGRNPKRSFARGVARPLRRLSLRTSDFGFLSDFGLRPSDLGRSKATLKHLQAPRRGARARTFRRNVPTHRYGTCCRRDECGVIGRYPGVSLYYSSICPVLFLYSSCSLDPVFPASLPGFPPAAAALCPHPLADAGDPFAGRGRFGADSASCWSFDAAGDRLIRSSTAV